uniref:Ribosomal L1 domain-containing protein 1 n=2 Tax=Nothobranchius kadleci TaxID=1051664 RepID=A0A1A8DM57_NOTKA
MRVVFAREADGMAEKSEVKLDRAQVKKAVQALQAFLKTKAAASDSLFSEETQPISLLFTLWKIPKKKQCIQIPLPHGHQSDTEEVCLFTKDEPRMTSDQTQRFYKKLLQEKGVKNISEIIPYRVLKTEYKPYEAKRRLLGNFSIFLADARVRRLLPSHLGKHFYERKRAPLSVNLQSNHLARDIQNIIQGTTLTVTNKGCCCMARVAQSDMTADEVTENIEAAVQAIVAKLEMKGPVMKLIHLKSQASVALPIYTSELSHLSGEDFPRGQGAAEKKKGKKTEDKKQTVAKKKDKLKKKAVGDEEEDEEIPQLVPIKTPTKKPKLEKPSKKQQQQLQKTAKPAGVKKGAKAPSKPARKAEKKGRRRALRAK